MCCHVAFFVGLGAFVVGMRQIFSFFSFKYRDYIKRTYKCITKLYIFDNTRPYFACKWTWPCSLDRRGLLGTNRPTYPLFVQSMDVAKLT